MKTAIETPSSWQMRRRSASTKGSTSTEQFTDGFLKNPQSQQHLVDEHKQQRGESDEAYRKRIAAVTKESAQRVQNKPSTAQVLAKVQASHQQYAQSQQSAHSQPPAPKGWPQEAWNNFQKYKHYYGLMQDRESGYTDMLGVFRYLIWAERHGAPKDVLQKEYEIIVPLLTKGAEMMEERNNISTAQELRDYVEEVAPGRVKGNNTSLMKLNDQLKANPELGKVNLSSVPRPPMTETVRVTGEQQETHNNKMVKYIVDSIIERLTLKYPNQPERKEYRKYTIETPEQFAKLREKIDWTHGEAREQSFLTKSFRLEQKLPNDPIFKTCYWAMAEAIMKACFKTQTTFSAVKIFVDVSQFKDALILDQVEKYFDEFHLRSSKHFTGSSTPQLSAISKPQPIPTAPKSPMFQTPSPQPLKKPPTPPESNSPINQYF